MNKIRWIAIAVIVGSVIALTRILPFDLAITLLQERVADFGVLGPVIFGAVYIVATVLFIPGSLLTLAGGAVFGIWVGTATVIISATIGGSLSFLIARYLLRSRIEALAADNPRFGAIDTAISEGGWKIVGLLRLSPAVPFTIANYLFGLTKVRFVSYAVTSFFSMLPGTFMYVYLGYAGRASAAGKGRTPAEWALLGVGLLATIAVTVYVTKLAKKALAERTALDEAVPKTDAEDTMVGDAPKKEKAPLGLVFAAAASIAVVALAYVNKTALSSIFGPPRVTLTEKFDDRKGGDVFDHSAFDAILAAHVDADGWTDYEAIGDMRADLDAYTATLATADLDKLGRDELLALYINAYNAYTLALILDHSPLESIKDIGRADRWDAVKWDIAGTKYSLNQIEHELIRGQFKEPRIHFAVNCASIGCPPLRSEAYTGAKLERQLAEQTDYVHSHDRWFDFDPDSGKLELTRLYQWYGNDFEQVSGSVIDYAAQFSPALAKAKADGKSIKREWLEYSWKLNSVKNRPGATREPLPAIVETAEPGNEPMPTAIEPKATEPPATEPPPSAEPAPLEPPVTAGKPAGAKSPATAPGKKTTAKKATAKPVPKKAAPRPEPEPKKPAPKPKKSEPPSGGGGGGGGGGSSGGGGGSSGAPIPRGYQ